jgi:hypothetical protein
MTSLEALARLKATEAQDAWTRRLFPSADPMAVADELVKRKAALAFLEAEASLEAAQSKATQTAYALERSAEARASAERETAWNATLYPEGAS